MLVNEEQIKTLTPKEVAQICDHAFLTKTEEYQAETGSGESPVRRREQEFYKFLEKIAQSPLKPYAICVRSEDVPHASRFFSHHVDEKLPIAAVVGFPNGHWYHLNYKLFEAQYAMNEGASEIDLVMNYQALKEGNHSLVLQEAQTIAKVVHQQNGKVKLILETSELSNQEIAQACHLAEHAEIDFIKTSTGFGSFGVQVEQLEVICRNFHGGVKISGGVNIENVHRYLSVIFNTRGDSFELSPDKVRIGETQLLPQLVASLR